MLDLIGSTSNFNYEILNEFMRKEGVLNKPFIVFNTTIKLFKKTPVYLGLDCSIYKGEFNGKIAYSLIIYNSGIYLLIQDDVCNDEVHKRALDEKIRASGVITVYGFNGRNLRFSNVKPIKKKQFNFIHDNNWNELVPLLDNFQSNKGLSGLSIYLYGLPGSGKTEFVRQIALYCAKDIYSVHLNDLNNAVESLKKNSIIVLEEIDKVLVNGDFTDETDIPTLLSVLDGSMIPDKTIVVTISNKDISTDNPIMMREGRLDIKLKFGSINRTQVESILNRWYPDADSESVWNIVKGKLTIAAFDLILKHGSVRGNTFDKILEDLAAKCATKNNNTDYFYI